MNILYELVKKESEKKRRKLKLVVDWDEVLKPLNPFVWYNLIKENGWHEGEIGSFENYFQFFWENASFEYHERGQKTTNTRNKVIEEYRKDPEVFQKKIREPFFKISKSFDFYNKAPWLLIAKELLQCLKEDLIGELLIISASPDKDYRKRKKFAETFGKFPGTAIELIPYQAPSLFRWEWIKENHSDFDVFIDDSSVYIERIRELFPEKNYVVPGYKCIEYPQATNVYRIENVVSDLKDEDFAKAAEEYKQKQASKLISRTSSAPNSERERERETTFENNPALI